MTPFTGRELPALLTALRAMYAEHEVEALEGRAVRTTLDLVASDHASFNDVDPTTARGRWTVVPAGADAFPGADAAFERLVHQHPFLRHAPRVADGRVHRLSELVSRRRFHRLALYGEYYRRIGIEHQVVFVLSRRGPRLRGVVLSRGGRDYTDRECARLALLAPHLAQAYATAEALGRARQAAGSTAAGAPIASELVLVSPAGRLDFATPRARGWLTGHLGARQARDGRLPGSVLDWMRAQERALEGADGPPPAPFVIRGEGRSLEIRLAWRPGGRALLLQERGEAPTPEALRPLGLSPREEQVLAWVAQGKTNGEIAAIVGTRPRTVAKHLERVFQKLGVETRTAAAAMALAAVSAG